MMPVFDSRRLKRCLTFLLACKYLSDTTEVNALATVSFEERTTLIGLLPQSGFICDSPTEVNRVCEACTRLENAGLSSASKMEEVPNTGVSEALGGKWRLRFTSASPYGLMRSLPEDAATLLLQGFPEPIRNFLIDKSVLLPLAIEQSIDIDDRRIANYIELAPWPKTDSTITNPISDALQQTLAALPGPVGQTLEAIQEATVRLELDHSFSVAQGSDGTNNIKLNLETVRRSLDSASDQLPSFIPRESAYDLPAPFNPSGTFETTYVDKSLRVARGRGWPFDNEVFIFERADVTIDLQADMEEDECELVFEEDGETPVLLCDNIDDADYMPSD